ncbi:MAG TPA: hypothetical protein VNV41_06695 [Candidatus Acidoferrales bacterium]|nr:hypothetical protein [Candidatus Acidoferrales bacterium]
MRRVPREAIPFLSHEAGCRRDAGTMVEVFKAEAAPATTVGHEQSVSVVQADHPGLNG